MGRGWVQFIRDDVDGARVQPGERGGGGRSWVARRESRCGRWPGWPGCSSLTGDWDRALADVDSGRDAGFLEWHRDRDAPAGVDRRADSRAAWRLGRRGVSGPRAADAVTQDYEMMRIPTLLARAQIAEAEADYARVRRVAGAVDADGHGHLTVRARLLAVAGCAGQRVGDRRPAAPKRTRSCARTRSVPGCAGTRSAMARLGYARGRLLGRSG